MYKSVYDTNDNGKVDVAELADYATTSGTSNTTLSVSGTTLPLDYYGTNDSNIKGYYPLVEAVQSVIENNPITIGESLVISSNLTPPIITGNVNNYYPIGLDTTTVIFISSTGNYNISGLKALQDGRLLIIINIGSFQIKFLNNSALSLAENRFYLQLDAIMKPGNGGLFVYSTSLQRWTLVSLT
jgi:hypothetical protein